MKSHTISLTEGPIIKNIIAFSVPILLSNILQQLYNSIDSAVVGRYAGSVALAAVGSTGALINLLTGFFLGLATGTGVLYAMHYGAGDTKGLKKLIDTALILSVIIGAFVTAVGVLFSSELLRLMNTPEEVLEPSRRYLTIYMSGTIVNMVYNVGSGMIRAEGDSARPLLYLALGGVVNLIADVVLVAAAGMGVAGAAWATVAAQAITAVLVLHRLTKLNKEYAFDPLHMTPAKISALDVTRISVPCGLQSSMYNISNLLVQAKINSFGAVAMAGIAAYGKIDAFIYMPMNAIVLSTSTYIGQNIGAGRYDRMRSGIRASLLLSVASSVVLSIAVLIFYDPLVRLFTTDLPAIEFGRSMMWFLVPFAWTYSISDTLGGAIRGAGQAAQATAITAFCICVFRIIWLECTLKFVYDIRIVFVCYPISWTLCNFTMLWYYFRKSTLMKSIQKYYHKTNQEVSL